MSKYVRWINGILNVDDIKHIVCAYETTETKTRQVYVSGFLFPKYKTEEYKVTTPAKIVIHLKDGHDLTCSWELSASVNSTPEEVRKSVDKRMDELFDLINIKPLEDASNDND